MTLRALHFLSAGQTVAVKSEDQLQLTEEVKARLDESRREIAGGNFQPASLNELWRPCFKPPALF